MNVNLPEFSSLHRSNRQIEHYTQPAGKRKGKEKTHWVTGMGGHFRWISPWGWNIQSISLCSVYSNLFFQILWILFQDKRLEKQKRRAITNYGTTEEEWREKGMVRKGEGWRGWVCVRGGGGGRGSRERKGERWRREKKGKWEKGDCRIRQPQKVEMAESDLNKQCLVCDDWVGPEQAVLSMQSATKSFQQC